MDADIRERHPYDPQCRALDVLHKAKACLDYCLSPVNKHADEQIIRVVSELALCRSKARIGKESGIRAELAFSDETVLVDTGLLYARCHYMTSLASFVEVGGIEAKPFDLKKLPNDSATRQFKSYLMTGNTDGVRQLNVQETCQLMMLAHEYQAKELEALCLFNILRGIRFDLFSEEELKLIVKAGPALAFTEIQATIKPLAENYKWDEPELKFLLSIAPTEDGEPIEAETIRQD